MKFSLGKTPKSERNQSDMNDEKRKKFSDSDNYSDVWFQVGTFLSIKDVIQLMNTSKSFFALINKYFHSILVGKGLVGIEMEGKFQLLFANYFCKSMINFHMSLKKNGDPKKENKLYSEDVIGYDDFGKSNVIYFENKRLSIEKKMLNKVFEIDQVETYCSNEDFLFLQKKNNSTYFFFYDAFEAKEIFISQIANQKINQCYINKEFLLIVSQNKENNAFDEIFVIDIESFFLKNFTPSLDHQKIKQLNIKELGIKKIHHASISKKKAYFISERKKIFEVKLEKFFNKEGISIKQMEFFSNKKIDKVFSNYDSYFAIEIIEQQVFRKYDNENVLDLAKKIELDDYLNTLKHSKISGKELVSCDQKFLKDQFGFKK